MQLVDVHILQKYLIEFYQYFVPVLKELVKESGELKKDVLKKKKIC